MIFTDIESYNKQNHYILTADKYLNNFQVSSIKEKFKGYTVVEVGRNEKKQRCVTMTNKNEIVSITLSLTNIIKFSTH